MSKLKLTLISGIAVIVAVGAVVLAGEYYFSDPNIVAGADADDVNLVNAGRPLYAEHCASCHGKKLEGQANWRSPLPTGGLPAPPHDASGHTWHHPDQLLFDYTKRGGQARAPAGFKSNMPGFAGTLSDAEIWAVLAFIKSKWPEKIKRRHAGLNQQN